MVIGLNIFPSFSKVNSVNSTLLINLKKEGKTMPKTRTDISSDDTFYCLFIIAISLVMMMIGSNMAFHG